MTLIAVILLIIYAAFLAFVFAGLNKGKFNLLLLYMVTFLPFYIVFLSFVYAQTESVILVRMIQYSKEIVLLYGLLIWLLGKKRNLNSRLEFSNLDWAFILFTALSFVYFLLPLGEATIVGKITYFKNIFLMSLVYFFGRNVDISLRQWKTIFGTIFIITAFAFLVVIMERFFGRHFHSVIGYAKYNLGVNNIEPQGNYGLKWTFEAQAGQPRYASFFSNPLEFAASLLISFSLSIYYFISVNNRSNQYKYLTLLLMTVICLLLAYSRATMVAFVGVLFIIALLLKYYKVVIYTFLGLFIMTFYILFFAPDDTRYFVNDTLTFQNSSSITHVIEWAEGIESIVTNPFGIGLAMSGNAGGVEDDLKVSGENQFLIYGVQLGIIGMLLYLAIFIIGIIHAWRAFRMVDSTEQQTIPFVAVCVKFGLILPLLTANVESYLYVSLFSWWLIGASETLYINTKKKKVANNLQLSN
jgi:O-antigen ligase/polysaccharide polymerase Wzy-like membrane protein